MYTSYFGFTEKPFNLTPDPRLFYVNPVYQEAFARLLYGIRERKGFILLTGEVGTGKTTLLRRLMTNLDGTVPFVFFYNTTLTFEELLTFACEELGLSVKGEGRLQKIRALNELLIAQLQKGGTSVILIDEAQKLSKDVLENLRLLSNLETPTQKLLQIVLVGQPELEVKLDHPDLRPVKHRIAIRYRLNRLKEREVGPFINYRLRAVGCERGDLFSPGAVQRIALYSQGIPRMINIVCDNALLIAYATSQKTVTPAIIDEVAQDLRLDEDVDAASVVKPTRARGEPQDGGEPPEDVPEKRGIPHRLTGVAAVALALASVLALGASLVAPPRIPEDLSRLAADAQEFLARIRERVPGLHSARAVAVDTTSAAVEPVAAPDALARSEPKPPGSTSDEPAEPVPVNDPPPARERLAPRNHGRASRTLLPSDEPLRGAEFEARGGSMVVIPAGMTVSEIAAGAYRSAEGLTIDLIKEFNPHIANLNSVLAGQTLLLPPLSQETLVRKDPTGYRLILSSHRSLIDAHRLARLVRLHGYDVTVTPRTVADDLSLHRVEIVALADVEAVETAWVTARTNRWLPFPDLPLRPR